MAYESNGKLSGQWTPEVQFRYNTVAINGQFFFFHSSPGTFQQLQLNAKKLFLYNSIGYFKRLSFLGGSFERWFSLMLYKIITQIFWQNEKWCWVWEWTDGLSSNERVHLLCSGQVANTFLWWHSLCSLIYTAKSESNVLFVLNCVTLVGKSLLSESQNFNFNFITDTIRISATARQR